MLGRSAGIFTFVIIVWADQVLGRPGDLEKFKPRKKKVKQDFHKHIPDDDVIPYRFETIVREFLEEFQFNTAGAALYFAGLVAVLAGRGYESIYGVKTGRSREFSPEMETTDERQFPDLFPLLGSLSGLDTTECQQRILCEVGRITQNWRWLGTIFHLFRYSFINPDVNDTYLGAVDLGRESTTSDECSTSFSDCYSFISLIMNLLF